MSREDVSITMDTIHSLPLNLFYHSYFTFALCSPDYRNTPNFITHTHFRLLQLFTLVKLDIQSGQKRFTHFKTGTILWILRLFIFIWYEIMINNSVSFISEGRLSIFKGNYTKIMFLVFFFLHFFSLSPSLNLFVRDKFPMRLCGSRRKQRQVHRSHSALLW